MKKLVLIATLISLWIGLAASQAEDTLLSSNPLIQTMDLELNRSMTHLKNAGKAPLYYLAYRLYEGDWETITASNGALLNEYPDSRWRMLSVDLRVGSPRFDNSHFLREKNSTPPHFWEQAKHDDSILPSAGAGLPLQQCIWLKTDDAFKKAQQRYSELCASNDVLSAEEDKSSDFSLQPAHRYQSPIKEIHIDRAEWEERVRRLSKLFSDHPFIRESTVSFVAEPTTRYMVNSEGSQLIEQHLSYEIFLRASTLAKDGMTVWLWDSIESKDPATLPNEGALAKRIERLAKSLDELRAAPAAESYVGPAILSGKAAAVFFHETFGHRIEGVHEKSENEGKTFARKIGAVVMPSFLSVVDDPTVTKANGEYLNGHYIFDDEGVPAQKVTLAKNGILTGFLLSRTLVQGFKTSNGHARSAPGWNPTARQGNLFVVVDHNKQVGPQVLRQLLITEARKQHKSYALFFDEIAGGSTFTQMKSDQTYFIYPLRVYKIFVDGRPDRLIRGAEIVGTPLAALERIQAASTDYAVFNGRCGRESGLVPVSAVAPSLLVQSIETKRTAKSFQKLPILPDPTSLSKGESLTK